MSEELNRRVTALSSEAVEIAAGCWCDPLTEHKVMDGELCAVFGERVQVLIDAGRADINAARKAGALEAIEELRTYARNFTRESFDWCCDTIKARYETEEPK